MSMDPDSGCQERLAAGYKSGSGIISIRSNCFQNKDLENTD